MIVSNGELWVMWLIVVNRSIDCMYSICSDYVVVKSGKILSHWLGFYSNLAVSQIASGAAPGHSTCFFGPAKMIHLQYWDLFGF